MNRVRNIVLLAALLALTGLNGFSQTKSIEQLQKEITAFKQSDLFSVTYERDITTVLLSFDLRGDDKGLKKKFKEFVFKLSAIYVGPGIDEKPFRNRLCVKTRSKKFHFASNRNLTLSLDEDTIDFGSAERSTTFRKRKASEVLCWEISRETLNDLAASHGVRLRIGGEKATIPPSKLSLFSDFSGLLTIKRD